MFNTLILGAGSIGSAFSIPCLDCKHKVTIVGTHFDYKLINIIKNNNNFHPFLKLKLPKKINILNHSDLNKKIMNKSDLVILAITSQGIEWAADQLKNFVTGKYLPPILMLTKGLSIYKNKYESLADKLERLLIIKGFKSINISVFGGPCLAMGLGNKVHTSIIISNKKIKNAIWLKNILSTNYLHISISDDRIGVEVCAAIKNVYSIIIGASKGLCNEKIHNNLKTNNYLNTAASLIKQSLHEMFLLINFFKGKKESVYGLAGLGDLYVSASGGRNSKIGSYLGNNLKYSTAKKLKMPNETIEGAELIFELGHKIKKDFNVKQFPLLFAIINAILYDKKIIINWNNFK